MAEEQVPLLNKAYHENCPGCKVERHKETYTGVPYKTLFWIWIIVFSNALPITSLFPFLYFMIRDFHVAEREEDTSYYAGFVGSGFMFGRALTSVFWGVVADKYGRKPVILIGTITAVLFNVLFGLSLNFWMAVCVRFLHGFFNGLMGPLKAYACEVVRPEHQAVAMSTVSTGWSIGLIVGPALGGLFAQPAEKYPQIFSEKSVFGRFPYLLPCLVTASFALAVFVVSLQLPESLHKHNGKHLQDDSTEALEASVSVKEFPQNNNSTPTPNKSLLRNWPLMSSIIVYCILAFHDMAYSEIFSLWAVSSRGLGGLALTSNDVGEILSFTGCGMMVFQLAAYPYVARRLGHVTVTRICSFLSIPLLQSYSLIATLSGLSLLLVLNCASFLKNGLMTSAMTGVFILQNNAVDQDQRGAANGLAMTSMSLFKAFGPACGGTLLSWAEKRHNATFLPGSQIVFFFLNTLLFLAFLCTFKPFLAVRESR